MRFLPHEPNFAPITAIALFGAVYLDKRLTIILPLLAMLVSDVFIGFYNPLVMVSVYLSFLISGCLGFFLRKRKTFANTLGVVLGSSVQFFLVTNFAVWLFDDMYPHTGFGLLASYTNALLFFRNTLLSDFFYVGVLFGTAELVRLTMLYAKGKLQVQQIK